MAVRKILRIGHPVLREVTEPVPESEIGSKELKKLIRDMFDTMSDAHGMGLAAPQIGISRKIVVVGIDRSGRYEDEKELARQVLINPEIEVLNKEMKGSWEGCLSVPEMRGYVERSRKIRLKYFDETGEAHDEIVEGYEAVVYQHECDHLDGILYTDRLKDPKMFGYNAELDAAATEISKKRLAV